MLFVQPSFEPYSQTFVSLSSSGNPFRTMEEELLHWQPAIGFPCLDADDCASASNAVLIPDVEVHPSTPAVFIRVYDQSVGSAKLRSRDVCYTQRSFTIFVSVRSFFLKMFLLGTCLTLHDIPQLHSIF